MTFEALKKIVIDVVVAGGGYQREDLVKQFSDDNLIRVSNKMSDGEWLTLTEGFYFDPSDPSQCYPDMAQRLLVLYYILDQHRISESLLLKNKVAEVIRSLHGCIQTGFFSEKKTIYRINDVITGDTLSEIIKLIKPLFDSKVQGAVYCLQAAKELINGVNVLRGEAYVKRLKAGVPRGLGWLANPMIERLTKDHELAQLLVDTQLGLEQAQDRLQALELQDGNDADTESDDDSGFEGDRIMLPVPAPVAVEQAASPIVVPNQSTAAVESGVSSDDGVVFYDCDSDSDSGLETFHTPRSISFSSEQQEPAPNPFATEYGNLQLAGIGKQTCFLRLEFYIQTAASADNQLTRVAARVAMFNVLGVLLSSIKDRTSSEASKAILEEWLTHINTFSKSYMSIGTNHAGSDNELLQACVALDYNVLVLGQQQIEALKWDGHDSLDLDFSFSALRDILTYFVGRFKAVVKNACNMSAYSRVKDHTRNVHSLFSQACNIYYQREAPAAGTELLMQA